MTATSQYLNETPRDLKAAMQDATEQAIRDLRAQVIWRANQPRPRRNPTKARKTA